MKIQRLRKRFAHYLDKILDHYSDPGNADPKTVHGFRLNLKRVDALTALLAFHSKRGLRKMTGLKSLFDMTGRLRSLQVEFEIISKYFDNQSLNPNYLHQLHEKKMKRLHQYTKALKRGPSGTLKKAIKSLRKKTYKITKEQIQRYLRKETLLIRKRLQRSIFREQNLHSLRKDLKLFYLNMKIAGHQNEDLAKLLELLGQWHDHQIAFDHIVKAIYTSGLTAPESEPIKKIKFDLIKEKELLYEQIVSFFTSKMHNNAIEQPIL